MKNTRELFDAINDAYTVLKNRLRTVEDFMTRMEIRDEEIDGQTYTLVVAKENSDADSGVSQVDRLNTKIFDFTLASQTSRVFTKEELNLENITDLGYSIYVKNIDSESEFYGKYTTAELLSDNYIDVENGTVTILNTSKFELEFKVVFRR